MAIMSIEQLNEITRDIASSGSDAGKVTALLTQIVDSYGELISSHAETKTANDTLTDENTKLKQYNLELFMQRGDKVRDEVSSKPNNGMSEEEVRASTITPETLFKELEVN